MEGKENICKGWRKSVGGQWWIGQQTGIGCTPSDFQRRGYRLTEDCVYTDQSMFSSSLLLSSPSISGGSSQVRSYCQVGYSAVEFTLPAAHPQVCSSREHSGERALPWTVGDPEGKRKTPSSLKGCKQLKEMLKGYLEMSWTRLFLFYLSFVTVTIRVNFSQAFS